MTESDLEPFCLRQCWFGNSLRTIFLPVKKINRIHQTTTCTFTNVDQIIPSELFGLGNETEVIWIEKSNSSYRPVYLQWPKFQVLFNGDLISVFEVRIKEIKKVSLSTEIL